MEAEKKAIHKKVHTNNHVVMCREQEDVRTYMMMVLVEVVVRKGADEVHMKSVARVVSKLVSMSV